MMAIVETSDSPPVLNGAQTPAETIPKRHQTRSRGRPEVPLTVVTLSPESKVLTHAAIRQLAALIIRLSTTEDNEPVPTPQEEQE